MSLTDDEMRFKDMSAPQVVFPIIDKEAESYWLHGDDGDEENIWVYGFNTPIELAEEMGEYIDEKRARMISGVAFKNRRNIIDKTGSNSAGSEMVEDASLPEFVYNF